MASVDQLFASFDADVESLNAVEFPRSTLGTNLARRLDRLVRELGIDRSDSALDMGCGSGLQALAMGNAGMPTVVALDINAQAVALARARFDRFEPGARIETGIASVTDDPEVPRSFRLMAFNPPGFVKPTPRTEDLMDQALFAGSKDEHAQPLIIDFLTRWVTPQLQVGGYVAFTWPTFVRVKDIDAGSRGIVEMVANALGMPVSGMPEDGLTRIRAPLAGYPGFDVFEGLSEDTVHFSEIDLGERSFEFHVVLLERQDDAYRFVPD